MWLFGYGSLMWDGWETAYGCVRREYAVAHNHRRVFNKKSLERWGTRTQPGLTLNLAGASENGSPCHGIAFEFPDRHQGEIEDYLSERETCTATEIAVHLPGETIAAQTYIYEGPRLVEADLPLRARAAMILLAEGVAGSSYEYIRNVRDHLAELGVADPAVDALWRAVVALKDGNAHG